MLRRFFQLILLLLIALTWAQAQEPGIQLPTQLYTLKAGPFGATLSFEKHLGQNFTLNTEVGLNAGYQGPATDELFNSYYILTPSLRLEPRHYYNLNKRFKAGKNTDAFAANYFSLSATYLPDLFTISNRENYSAETGFAIIPKWGMRRNLGKHFFFEFAAGLGPYFEKNRTRMILDADIKFGLKF